MKTLQLTQNRVTILDDNVYDKVKDFSWFYSKKGYAVGRMGTKKLIYLHRVVIGASKGEEVDHINRNKLDNRLVNLRVCTHQENMVNVAMHSDNRTGYKNIHWYASRNKWLVQIMRDGKKYYLGYYKNIDEAVKVRDAFYEGL